jgi:hypothetical protein
VPVTKQDSDASNSTAGHCLKYNSCQALIDLGQLTPPSPLRDRSAADDLRVRNPTQSVLCSYILKMVGQIRLGVLDPVVQSEQW